jgi:hypothetical protein
MGMRVETAGWLKDVRVRVATLVVQAGAVPVEALARIAPALSGPPAAAAALELDREHARAAAAAKGGSGGGGDGARARLAQRPVTRAAAAEAARQAAAARARRVAAARRLPAILLCMARLRHQPPPVFMSLCLAAAVGVRGARARPSPPSSADSGWGEGADAPPPAAASEDEAPSAFSLGPVGQVSLLLSMAYMRYNPHPTVFGILWASVLERWVSAGAAIGSPLPSSAPRHETRAARPSS